MLSCHLFPAGRFLVATGQDPAASGKKVEIVDLSDPTKNCDLLDDIPPRFGSAGGLLDGNPVICGGVYPSSQLLGDCIVFGHRNLVLKMKQKRRYFSAVSLNSSTLWLLGSDHGSAIDSTEFISLSDGPVNGPRLPFKYGHSCVVKYNDNTIYFLGGYQSGLPTDNVWIASISDEITFSQGPSMFQSRYYHACGTISIGNKKLIIVAGGFIGAKGISSVEILDPSINQWVKGT